MFNISQFLKRATGKQGRELYFRKSIQDLLKERFDLEVPFEMISLKSGTIYIKNIPQSARTSIFIKKTAILQEINRIQDIYVILDVR
ncbi:MAG: hypothetical protein WCV79_00540 [Candidatus Paceibacterota bacterium]